VSPWIAAKDSLDTKSSSIKKSPLTDTAACVGAAGWNKFARVGKKRGYALFINPNKRKPNIFRNA